MTQASNASFISTKCFQRAFASPDADDPHDFPQEDGCVWLIRDYRFQTVTTFSIRKNGHRPYRKEIEWIVHVGNEQSWKYGDHDTGINSANYVAPQPQGSLFARMGFAFHLWTSELNVISITPPKIQTHHEQQEGLHVCHMPIISNFVTYHSPAHSSCTSHINPLSDPLRGWTIFYLTAYILAIPSLLIILPFLHDCLLLNLQIFKSIPQKALHKLDYLK